MTMLSKDFHHKYKVRIKETSIIKIQKVLHFLGLSDLEIYLRDGHF